MRQYDTVGFVKRLMMRYVRVLALISDPGMTLSEVAGVLKDDIILDVPIPNINLQSQSWRRLKTKFRDRCFEKGMNVDSVKRVFDSVRSIINLNVCEYGLEDTNALSGIFMPYGFDTPKMQPLTNNILKITQRLCQRSNDESRWLGALISDNTNLLDG